MPEDVEALRGALTRWYARSHRELPWRSTRDAYRVWVSEIMLQQTRVDTVIPYYQRFLARFPDVERLAQAPLDDVLTLWSGLGYYRRARLLHAAAAVIVREHDGRFPRDLDASLALPGIGRSTAGAIVSISYDERAPVLDGNVQRVLVRRFGLRGDPTVRPLGPRLWALAQQLVDCEAPGDVNQALMELGATVCLPFANARCQECPLRASCEARAAGSVAQLPETRRGAKTLVQTWAVALAQRGRRFLVRQRPDSGLLRGLFELPTVELSNAAAATPSRRRRALAAFLHQELKVSADVSDEIVTHRHAISNRRVTERVLRVSIRGRLGANGRWLDPDGIRALPITTATRKILDRLAGDGDAQA